MQVYRYILMYLYCDHEIEKALSQVQNRRLGLSSAEQHILLPSASCSPSNHQHAQRLVLRRALKPNSYLFSINSLVLSWGKNTSYFLFSLVNKCLQILQFHILAVVSIYVGKVPPSLLLLKHTESGICLICVMVS